MKKNVKKVLNDILKKFSWETNFELREPPEGFNYDLATNLPLIISKKYKISPVEVFKKIKSDIETNFSNYFNKIEYSHPGFLNFNLNFKIFVDEIKNVLMQKEKYPLIEKKSEKVLIEYVSSNPTGPLHIGHGRCAVIGDVLANVLEQLGYEVYREYYNNDRGRQVNILTASVLVAGKEIEKEKIEPELLTWAEEIVKENSYKGDYIKDVAKVLLRVTNYPLHITNLDKIKKQVVEIVMNGIKETLQNFRAKFDNFYSENSLYESGVVDKVKNDIQKKGLVEENDGAIWFKVKEIGDEKDRVIVRSNGEPTYFLSDIAYHLTKLARGYNWLINVWGTDHHGYVPRLKSALKSVSENNYRFDIILYQLVALVKNGQRISMSTREGKFVTLDEVVSEVGVDVTRYFLLTKSPNTHLDFDFDLAKEHSLKNPVYYIQYAYTRCCGIFRELKMSEEELFKNQEMVEKINNELKNLKNKEEIDLIKKLCFYEDILYTSVENFSPNYLCTYLLELAKTFHKFYENCRVIIIPQVSSNDKNKTCCSQYFIPTETSGFSVGGVETSQEKIISYPRLGLILATKTVLNNGLKLLGINPPERM